MPVPFYVRYLIICKNITITLKQLILIYIPIIGYSFTLYLAAIWCYPPNPSAYTSHKAALMTKFWLDEYKDGPIFIATSAGDIRLITTYVMMSLASCFSYLLVSIFYIKISKHMKLNEFHMSKRTLILNNQLQKTLIVQTIGPFITGNLPCCILVVMNLFSLENHYISLGCCFLLSWVSIINPIAAIIIITPYRNKVKQLLRIKNNQIQPISTNENYEVNNTPNNFPPGTVNSNSKSSETNN